MDTIYRKVDKEEVLQISSRVLQYLKIELKEFKLSPSIYNNVARLLTELDSIHPIEPQEPIERFSRPQENDPKVKFDAQSISDLLNGLKVDKNGHIRGKSRVIDQIQSLHLQSIESEKNNECHCGGYPDCICDITTHDLKTIDQARDDYYNQDKLFEHK